MDTNAASNAASEPDYTSREWLLATLRVFGATDEAERFQQNPISRRRLARDVAEMVNDPYPNTRLIPRQDSRLVEACLLLDTGTRLVHVTLVFRDGYPDTAPLAVIDGRRDIGPRGDRTAPCADLLEQNSYPTQAYTIKTLAIHLLSMFDGDKELFQDPEGENLWLPSRWAALSCDGCGYPRISCNADEYAVSQPSVTGTPGQPRTIQTLPTELLKGILEFLEVQDIVLFGQAWAKMEEIVEEHGVIRDRELRCFVTKEHFTHCPLGIGIYTSFLPQLEGRTESEFDLVSSDTFWGLGVNNTVYGCEVNDWLPLPLSHKHWDTVKDDAYESLDQLAAAQSRRQNADVRRAVGLADHMDVLTAFMEDHVTRLLSIKPGSGSRAGGLLRPSEKAIESLFFLFHLLLCVAVDNPGYVDKANKMMTEFQANGPYDRGTPSPGRLLAALLIADVETDANFLPKLFFEAVTRNVPRLLRWYPELEYLEHDGAASPYRLHHTFTHDLASYRALLLMDLFRREARSATTGDTPEEKRNYLFRRRGLPPAAALASLAAELPRIAAVGSFPGFLNYLGIYRDPDERFLAGKLRDAVRECVISRGLRDPWPLGQEDGAVLRRAAEERSPLPETEDLPPYPYMPLGLRRRFAGIDARFWA